MKFSKPLIAAVIAAAGGAALARALPPLSAAQPSAIAFSATSPSVAASPGSWAPSPIGDMGAGREERYPARHAARSDSSAPKAVVYVAGEVVRPGIYRLSDGARADDALHAAGGPTRNADLVAVDLAERIEDGAEIDVPAKGSSAADGTASTAGVILPGTRAQSPSRHRVRHRRRKRARVFAADDTSAQGYSASDAPAPLSLNTADVAALQTLPGIGPALAARIVAYRAVNGPFASVDELLDVGGMTQSKVDALAPWLNVN